MDGAYLRRGSAGDRRPRATAERQRAGGGLSGLGRMGSVGFVVAIIAATILVIIAMVNRAEYISAEVKIERLRYDMRELDVRQAEDVIGQATAWNQRIVSEQRWNRVPVICLLVPNGWDNIKTLETPRGELR